MTVNKKMWVLRNPGKPLPRTPAASQAYQDYLAEEKESAKEKELLRAARKAAKELAKALLPPGDGEAEEEIPLLLDGAPVIKGYTILDPEKEKDADDVPLEELSKSDYEDETADVEEGLDQWGFPYFLDKYHPNTALDKEYSVDATPSVELKISVADLTDSDHMVKPDEDTVERLTMKNKWNEDDFDPTLWGDRGTGRMKIVGYRRRLAENSARTNGTKITRLVQNNRLVTFHIVTEYGSARCIPYTQLAVTDSANGCFEKDPHWLRAERFSRTPHNIKRERKTYQMVDLAELFYWGQKGMHWRSGYIRNMLGKEELKKSRLRMKQAEDE